jgi:hypothetical protein
MGKGATELGMRNAELKNNSEIRIREAIWLFKKLFLGN